MDKEEKGKAEVEDEERRRTSENKCPKCDEKFINEEDLKEHEEWDHEWKCDQCEKRYVCVMKMEDHLRKEHRICTKCDEKFKNECELTEHEKKYHEWKCLFPLLTLVVIRNHI